MLRFLLPLLLVSLCACASSPPIAAPTNVSAAPANANTTESGLSYIVLKQGSGSKPGPRDKVTVHYTGWSTDGQMVDSSVSRGRPAQFVLGEVIQGWTEGLQLMKAGSRFRFWIPEPLAYAGQEGFPQGMLVFDIALISVD